MRLKYLCCLLLWFVLGVDGTCRQRKDWPGQVLQMCGTLVYPANIESWESVSQAISSKLQEVRRLLDATQMVSAECLEALQKTICIAHIPGCTSTDKPLQGCLSHCVAFRDACAAPLSAATTFATRATLDCRLWTFGNTNCPSFEREAPCLTSIMSQTSNMVSFESQPSKCLTPPAENNREIIDRERQPIVTDYKVQDKTYASFVWAIALVSAFSFSLAFTTAIGKVRRDGSKDEYTFSERIVSIRFCAQIVNLFLSALIALAVFYVATAQSEEDLKLTFSRVKDSQEMLFAQSRTTGSTLSNRYLQEVCNDASGGIRVVLNEVKSSHIQSLVRYTSLPAVSITDVLQSAVDSIRLSSDNTNVKQLGVVTWNSTAFARLVTRTSANLLIGTVASNRQHIGLFGSTSSSEPVFYPEPISSMTPVSAVGLPSSQYWTNNTDFARHSILSSVPIWDFSSIQFGAAIISVATSVNSDLGSYIVERTILSSQLNRILTDISSHTFQNTRIVMVGQGQQEGQVLATSHGTLLDSDGTRHTEIQSADDEVSRVLVSGMLQRYGSISQISMRKLTELTEIDYKNDPYLIRTLSFTNSNIRAVIFAMAPLMELQGDYIKNNLLIRDKYNNDIQDVHQQEKDSHRFLILVSVLSVSLSLLLSLVAANIFTTALFTMIDDLRDVSRLHLDRAHKRQQQQRQSKFLEVREIQSHIKTAVQWLVEYRRAFPSLAIEQRSRANKKDDSGSDFDDNETTSSNDSDELVMQEQSCRVRVTYISRSLLKKAKLKKPSGDAESPTSKDVASIATKRSATFDWHYNPAKASLTDLLKECRAAVGEPPGEPLSLVAIPNNSNPTESNEEYPLVFSHHLQDYLRLHPDEISLVCKKASKLNLLAPLTAMASVFGKIGLIFVVFRMFWTGDASAARLASVLVATLIASFTLNIIWSFKLNKKANDSDEHMSDWTSHFQTETTVVMVLCGFNIQNMLVLWSGLRIGKLLRFHAPMPRRIRNQTIRWSMFSLVIGDLLPLMITLFYLGETSRDGWNDLLTEATVGVQLVAILSSSIKKFVVFCLLDDEKEERDEQTAEERRREKTRNAVLMPTLLTFVRIQIADVYELEGKCEPKELTLLLNAFYKLTMQALVAHQGIVTHFANGEVHGVFNYPMELESHEQDACNAVFEVLITPLPVECLGHCKQSSWLRTSIVTGEFQKGSLGGPGRKGFHFIGKPEILSRALCSRCSELGAQSLISSATYQNALQDASIAKQYLLRKVEVIRLSGTLQQEDVYQLIPLELYPKQVASLMSSYAAFFDDVFSRKAPDDALSRMRRYIHEGERMGYFDAAGNKLIKSLEKGIEEDLPHYVCGCGESKEISLSSHHNNYNNRFSDSSGYNMLYPPDSQSDSPLRRGNQRWNRRQHSSINTGEMDDTVSTPGTDQSGSEVKVGDVVEVINMPPPDNELNGQRGKITRINGGNHTVLISPDYEAVVAGRYLSKLEPSSIPSPTVRSPLSPGGDSFCSAPYPISSRSERSTNRVLQSAIAKLGITGSAKSNPSTPLYPPRRRSRRTGLFDSSNAEIQMLATSGVNIVHHAT